MGKHIKYLFIGIFVCVAGCLITLGIDYLCSLIPDEIFVLATACFILYVIGRIVYFFYIDVIKQHE